MHACNIHAVMQHTFSMHATCRAQDAARNCAIYSNVQHTAYMQQAAGSEQHTA